MKTTRIPTVILLAAALTFNACSSDDDMTTAHSSYTDGFFVLNEGGFQKGNSSVSFVNDDLQRVEDDIFYDVNNDHLGDIGQSIGFHDGLAYIVVNGSKKIEVVDRDTFERVVTIDDGLHNPRYITFVDGQGYVTDWGNGSDPNDDFVAIIDTESFSVLATIGVEEGPERILSHGGKLYVTHPGGWGTNDKVTVLHGAETPAFSIITVGDLPNGIGIVGDHLWVSCNGYTDYSGAGNDTPGRIVQIDLTTDDIVGDFEISLEDGRPANLVAENDNIYYTIGKSVYRFEPNNTGLPEGPLFTIGEAGVLHGFEVKEGHIYATLANDDFTGNGRLVVYDSAGGQAASLQVGVNPSGVYFD